MGNQRVSQLVQLYLQDIQPNDVFLVTDISALESKQMEVSQLLLYFEQNGIFNSYNSTLAATASYIKASNIDGLEIAGVIASQSISSSYSLTSSYASYSLASSTASYSSFCVSNMTNAQTASYLQYTGIPNGTSSYSVYSPVSGISTQSLKLYYDGINPNGTASYSITSSNAINAIFATSASFITNNATIANATFSSASLSSSWASQSLSSSYSSMSLNSLTSSIALTASYVPAGVIVGNVTSASYSKTSSYALNGMGGGSSTNIIGHSWNIVGPRATFAYSGSLGGNLYVIAQNATTTTGSMFLLNRGTNLVIPITSSTSGIPFLKNDAYFCGRPFISNYDNESIISIINTQTSLYSFCIGNITTPSPANLYSITPFSSSVTTNTIQNDLPVMSDFSTAIGNTYGNLYPTYYSFHYGAAAGTGGQLYGSLTLYKMTHTGTSMPGTYTRTSIGTINILNVLNNVIFLQFYTGNLSNAYNTLLWDYNYILQKLYLIDTAVGFLHIFTQVTPAATAPRLPLDASTFVSNNFSYVASYAVSLPHGESWGTTTTDKFLLDYDPVNGTEYGLTMIRYGNASYGGTVSYIPWPVNGN